MPIEEHQRQKTLVRDLFTGIAEHYDRVNRLISLGQDQRWRRKALVAAALPAGGGLLDVATGTGDMALLACRQRDDLRVVGTDLTPAMLVRAQAKARALSAGDVGGEGRLLLPLVVSDGLALAFSDHAFDAVTSAFMMRNVPDVVQAFREQARVVRSGGRVVCLEMTWPRWFPMNWLFRLYFFIVPPILGKLLTGKRMPYRYLPRSVEGFLDPRSLAQRMEQAGLHEVTWRSMMLGTVVLHTGRKP